MLDLWLAVGHHLLIFALFGVLVAELVMVRRGMDENAVAQVAQIDLSYGVLAVLIIIVGFSRAIFAAKGWDYYAHSAFFWAKITTFALIGLLSVRRPWHTSVGAGIRLRQATRRFGRRGAISGSRSRYSLCCPPSPRPWRADMGKSDDCARRVKTCRRKKIFSTAIAISLVFHGLWSIVWLRRMVGHA